MTLPFYSAAIARIRRSSVSSNADPDDPIFGQFPVRRADTPAQKKQEPYQDGFGSPGGRRDNAS
jgi:hypothetical protein